MEINIEAICAPSVFPTEVDSLFAFKPAPMAKAAGSHHFPFAPTPAPPDSRTPDSRTPDSRSRGPDPALLSTLLAPGREPEGSARAPPPLQARRPRSPPRRSPARCGCQAGAMGKGPPRPRQRAAPGPPPAAAAAGGSSRIQVLARGPSDPALRGPGVAKLPSPHPGGPRSLLPPPARRHFVRSRCDTYNRRPGSP